MKNNYFAYNIKYLRKYYHMSQDEMARIVGKTYSAVSLWERELREPSNADINGYCEHFGLRPEDLMYRQLDNEAMNTKDRDNILLLLCRKMTNEEFNKVFDFAFNLLAESHPNLTLEELNNADL